MKEELISFETAKLAKEKGFDKVLCNGYYFGTDDCVSVTSNKQHISKDKCLAPTQSLLSKWLRKIHSIYVFVDESGRPHIRNEDGELLAEVNKNNKFAGFPYETALEYGLFEALKLIK